MIWTDNSQKKVHRRQISIWKKWSTSLVVRKVQIKTTSLNYHNIGMSEIKKDGLCHILLTLWNNWHSYTLWQFHHLLGWGSSLSSLLSVFIMKEYWILSYPFSAAIKMIMWYLSLIVLIWCVILVLRCKPT